MKALVVSLIVLSSSSTVLAQGAPASNSITCEVGTLLAAAGGLMPSLQNIKLTTPLQDPKNVKIENCAKQVRGEFTLTMCASTASFIGGFEVGLLAAPTANLGEINPASTALLATRQNGRGLIEVNGSGEQVLSPVLERLTAAGIKTPAELDGDSMLLDDAVKEGVAAGVLKLDEPILFELRGCQL